MSRRTGTLSGQSVCNGSKSRAGISADRIAREGMAGNPSKINNGVTGRNAFSIQIGRKSHGIYDENEYT